MAEIHPIAKARKQKCPICSKPSDSTYRPFCSARCKQVDLGRWFGESYRVASQDPPDEDEIEALADALERGEREP